MWNQRFQFDIQVPELVMVRFVVEDYDSTSHNDLIGQYCLPLTSIQNGKKTFIYIYLFIMGRASRTLNKWTLRLLAVKNC